MNHPNSTAAIAEKEGTNFTVTKLLQMNFKTYLAVGELVQAAAHQYGVVGPVQFTVCPVRNYEDLAESDRRAEHYPEPKIILRRAICRTPGTPGISNKRRTS